jgi:O-antigen/teichoic acid export membrane protein
MGIIQRESIRSTIISYGGALLGAVNQLVLFTQLLPSEREVGLANVLVLIAITYAQLSGLGGAQIILRFFPFFRQTEKGHNGILFGILLLVTVGFGFFTLLFFLFHNQVVGYFEGNSPLIAEYIDYAVPLAYCWILLNIFDSYLRSLYKTVFATWVREIIKRGFITISVLAFAFGWVDLTGFVLLYILGQCLQPFLLLAYIAYIGELHLKPQFGRLWQQLSRKMLLYGGVSFLAYGSSLILGYIDSIMLGGMESEGEAGIYTISLYATSLILIPWRALAKITTPQVADYWQQKAHDKLQALYQRTSLINLVVGLFCFLGIWLNRHNLYAITGEAYSGGFWVLLAGGPGPGFRHVDRPQRLHPQPLPQVRLGPAHQHPDDRHRHRLQLLLHPTDGTGRRRPGHLADHGQHQPHPPAAGMALFQAAAFQPAHAGGICPGRLCLPGRDRPARFTPLCPRPARPIFADHRRLRGAPARLPTRARHQ